MKTIGLIGGMSWEASARYYKLINEGVRDKLGELHSANIVMSSMDFYELEKLQKSHRWGEAAMLISKEANNLIGIDALAICSVTGHEGSGLISSEVDVPLLHIADAINDRTNGIDKVGLLGTKYTMEMGYFKDKINAEVVIPGDCNVVNDIIYKELCLGEIKESSREIFKTIINDMVVMGAKAVILGCTEVGLLIGQRDTDIPIFDSTKIHSKAIVDYACSSVHNL